MGDEVYTSREELQFTGLFSKSTLEAVTVLFLLKCVSFFDLNVNRIYFGASLHAKKLLQHL